MTDHRIQQEIADFSRVKGDPPEDGPAEGEIYADTVLNHGELVEILHVGSDHAIVQRKNGVGRYPNWDFRPGGRFQKQEG